MLGGEGKHPHAVIGEERRPGIRVKAGRVPALVDFVVAGAFRIAKIEKGPGLVSETGNRIQTPVNAHPILHVEKGFVRGRRSPMISWLWHLFYIRLHPAVVMIGRRQMMRRSVLSKRLVGGHDTRSQRQCCAREKGSPLQNRPPKTATADSPQASSANQLCSSSAAAHS